MFGCGGGGTSQHAAAEHAPASPTVNATRLCTAELSGTIERVIDARSLSGKELLQWIGERSAGRGEVEDPAEVLPRFPASESYAVCLFRVRGFHPPGPPGAYPHPLDGAVFIIWPGHEPFVDAVGPLGSLRAGWAQLP